MSQTPLLSALTDGLVWMTCQEAAFLRLPSLPAGFGGPNSWDQAEAGHLVRREGQEGPTSKVQAWRGSKEAVPFGARWRTCDVWGPAEGPAAGDSGEHPNGAGACVQEVNPTPALSLALYVCTYVCISPIHVYKRTP